MLGLFKKEKELLSPISGKAIDLKEVPDEVFAGKMAGDGIAIVPTGNIAVAPADGELTMLFGTKHAYGMTLADGVEVLVHIGIDTVVLKGEGFEALAKQGDRVKKGTPIIRFDTALIESKGYSLISPVLITDPSAVKNFKALTGMDTEAGVTPVITYSTK